MSDRMKTIVRVAFIVVGVVLLLKFSFDWVSAKRDYDRRMDAAAVAIAETQSSIMANQKILDEAKDEMQVLSGNLHDMNELGKTIADLQTDYANYSNFYGLSQIAAREGTGVTDRIQEIQESLLKYFDDDDVYLWFDWVEKAKCQWECVTRYSFYGDGMKVMWICRPYGADLYNTSNAITVYAYALADYDYVSNHFSNLQSGVTKSGMKYLFTYEDSLYVEATAAGQLALDRAAGIDHNGNIDYELADMMQNGDDQDSADGMDYSGESDSGSDGESGIEDGLEPDFDFDSESDDGDDGGGDIFG